jgi:sigma-B regulation protein RsbU (phosphoserine phosphatase)
VYSWFYAVKNAEGEAIALIGCDYRIDSLTAQVIEETLLILLPMCIALLFIVVLLIAFMNKKVFAPIKIISSRMNSFIDERKQDFKPLNINSGDEIQGIANSFEKMSKDINNYIETNQKLITESVQAKVQMDVANRIQCGIVPSQLSIEGDNYSVFGYAKPAKEVGGDFYDCFTLPDGRVCIFIGDVSGKGIGAALFMVMVKTMLKDYLNSNLSPAKALNMVNDTLCNSNPEGMFATVFVAVFNAQSRQLTFANAGHTRPVMLGSTPKFLAVDSGVAIGLFEDIGICDNCITLSDGGLLLYTDGVTEANNSQKQFFGDKALLSATQGGNSAKGVIEQLNGRVNNFVGQNEQFDDYTAIALWLKEAAVKKFTFEREAASWQKLQQIILSYNSQNLNKKAVCLACEEAFINIVNYSKATFIEVGLGEEGDIFKVTFKDNGIRFNPLDEREQKSFEEYDGGGMGIGIIKNLADAHYSYEDNYNVLTLNFLKK